jgi:hypothetical protein
VQNSGPYRTCERIRINSFLASVIRCVFRIVRTLMYFSWCIHLFVFRPVLAGNVSVHLHSPMNTIQCSFKGSCFYSHDIYCRLQDCIIQTIGFIFGKTIF